MYQMKYDMEGKMTYQDAAKKTKDVWAGTCFKIF